MHRRKKLLLALAFIPAFAQAANTSIAFTDRSKVADPTTDMAFYGGGQHSLQYAGTSLVAAFLDERYGNSVWIAHSLDRGATWLPAKRAAYLGAITLSGYGPVLAVGPDPAGAEFYRVHIVYEGSDAAIYYTHARISPGAGRAAIGDFSPPAQVIPAGIANSMGELALTADSLGGVHVATNGARDDVWGTVYSRSTDYGASFVEVASLVVPNGRFPALASAPTGETFLLVDNYPSGVQVAKRAPGAAAFEPLVTVPTIRGGEVSIAVADASRLFVASVGSAGTLQVARSTDSGASWSIFESAPITWGAFAPSVAVSALGTVGVAWSDRGGSLSGYSRSTDGGVTWTPPTFVADMNWGATLAFDAAGKANIAFVHSLGGEAIYFVREK